jgi:hypothetical protein
VRQPWTVSSAEGPRPFAASQRTSIPVYRESLLGLPPASVQRQHQHGPHPFPQRVEDDLLAELCHGLVRAAQRKVGLNAQFDGARRRNSRSRRFSVDPDAGDFGWRRCIRGIVRAWIRV